MIHIILAAILISAIAGCISIPARDTNSPEYRSEHYTDNSSLNSNHQSNRLQYAQAYQDYVHGNMTTFSKVEEIENGCIKFYSGSGNDRKEIVPLFLPTTCNILYKYTVQATLQCNSKGNLQFPIPAKRKNVFWMIEGKNGVTQSDSDGKIRLIFFSATPFSVDYKLVLSLDEEFKSPLLNRPLITIPDDQCFHENK